MKKYSIALLFLFCFKVQAQIIPPQAVRSFQLKVDSVQTLIDHQPRTDSNTVIQLNELARFCFYDMQFKRGMIATVEARQLAKKLDFAKGEGLYYRTLYFFNYYTSFCNYYYNYKAKWAYSDRKQTEGNFFPKMTIPDNG